MNDLNSRQPWLAVAPSIVAALLLSLAMPRIAQGSPSQPEVKRVPAPYTSPSSGSDMYREYCAACHGASGKGDGPAAAALKSVPTDLTQLSARNSGKFPEIRFQEMVERGPVAAHGSTDMPVWGRVFTAMGDHTFAVLRVRNLMDYVKQLQGN